MDAYALEITLTATLCLAVLIGWVLRWLWDHLARRTVRNKPPPATASPQQGHDNPDGLG